MTIDKNFQAYWNRVREKGKFRYCLLQGVRFGGILYIVNGLINFPNDTFTHAFFSLNAVWRICFGFILGGILAGPLFWRINEKSVRKKEQLDNITKT